MYALSPITENPWVASLFFLFIFMDLLTIGRDNLLVQQWNVLFELRNTRIFEVPLAGAWLLRMGILLQYFLCGGVSLYFLVHPIFSDWQIETSLQSPLCLLFLAPLLWFLFQLATVNLFCYIFGQTDTSMIFSRSYVATYVLLGPVVAMVSLLLLSGHYDIKLMAILLGLLFVIAQLLFIYTLFKIFFRDIVSLCLIILYLCTLEIAPLCILYHKIAL